MGRRDDSISFRTSLLSWMKFINILGLGTVRKIINHKNQKKQINLKPGEMLLYESAKLWHGRQFPFEGDFFDNVFIHYTPNGDIERFEKLDEKMKSPAFLMEFQK